MAFEQAAGAISTTDTFQRTSPNTGVPAAISIKKRRGLKEMKRKWLLNNGNSLAGRRYSRVSRDAMHVCVEAGRAAGFAV